MLGAKTHAGRARAEVRGRAHCPRVVRSSTAWARPRTYSLLPHPPVRGWGAVYLGDGKLREDIPRSSQNATLIFGQLVVAPVSERDELSALQAAAWCQVPVRVVRLLREQDVAVRVLDAGLLV